MIGEKFNTYVTLSPQYVRDPNSVATLDAKLKLKKMAMNYSKTGYFEVCHAPRAQHRRPKCSTPAGSAPQTNLIQSFPIQTGPSISR
jgi:hypothetical protein